MGVWHGPSATLCKGEGVGKGKEVLHWCSCKVYLNCSFHKCIASHGRRRTQGREQILKLQKAAGSITVTAQPLTAQAAGTFRRGCKDPFGGNILQVEQDLVIWGRRSEARAMLGSLKGCWAGPEHKLILAISALCRLKTDIRNSLCFL